jgi:outer membrane protein assembly factor BamA
MSALVKIRSIYVLLLVTVIMQACNLPKLARKEGPFLFENKLKVEGNRDAILLSSNFSDYIKQKPNKKLLGITRIGLRSYKFGARFPNSRFSRFFQIKIGESPVILDSSLIESSVIGIKNYLKTQGYYTPEISYEVKGRIHKKKVSYIVKPNNPYKIKDVSLHIADRILDSIARLNMDDSYTKYTFRMSIERFLKEKGRLAEIYRNHGYFDFTKENISYDLDTNIGNFEVDLGINIPNPPNFNRFKPYKIKQIGIRVEPNKIDSNLWGKDSLFFKDFYYFPNTFKLNPEVLQNTILFKPGTVFREDLANASFNRLNDLRIFKSVNLNAIPENGSVSSFCLVTCLPSASSPVTAGISIGEGR